MFGSTPKLVTNICRSMNKGKQEVERLRAVVKGVRSMFPFIDLSRMLEKPKCAIHVASLEEAKAVIYNAKIQFPERVHGWDAESSNHWQNNREDTGYTMFYEGDDEPTTMSFTDIQWFMGDGYVVIEFDELLVSTVDIEESDQPVDILFGGTV